MSEEQKNCPTCGRPTDLDNTIATCHQQGSPICHLVRDKNSLLAATRLLAKKKCDKATVRTVLAIVEKIEPSPNVCPLEDCRNIGVLDHRTGTLKAHHKKVTDKELCPAAFKPVIGGIVIFD